MLSGKHYESIRMACSSFFSLVRLMNEGSLPGLIIGFKKNSVYSFVLSAGDRPKLVIVKVIGIVGFPSLINRSPSIAGSMNSHGLSVANNVR